MYDNICRKWQYDVCFNTTIDSIEVVSDVLFFSSEKL